MKKKRMGRKSLKIKWFKKEITKKDRPLSIYMFGHEVIRYREKKQQ